MNTVSDIFGTSNKYVAKAPVNKFQAQQANLTQSNYQPTVGAAQTGAAGQMNANAPIQAQESALAQSLNAQAQGQGPNPALEQLRQTTGQNINTAAGQAASSRGINPALAARLATDSAGTANQTAAGQAATLRAQQMLAAQQQEAGVLQGQASQNIGQQVANTQLLGTAGGLQQGQNALTLQNVLGTEGLNEQVAQQNAALQLGAEQINAGVAAQNTQVAGNMFGGMMNMVGSVASGPGIFGGGGGGAAGGVIDGAMAAGSEGGEVQSFDDGGFVDPLSSYLDNMTPKSGVGPEQSGSPPQGAMSGIPQDTDTTYAPSRQGEQAGSLTGIPRDTGGAGASGTPTMPVAGTPHGDDIFAFGKAFSAVGHAMSGPTMGAFDRFGAGRLSGSQYADGGSIFHGPVPGTAPVAGDSKKNDIVPAALSPGEYVVKRTAMQQPGVKEFVEHINSHPEQARDLVAHLVRRSGSRGYDRVLRARRMAEGGPATPAPADEPPPEENPSLWEKFKAWASTDDSASADEKEKKSRGVVDAVASKIPEVSDTRKAVNERKALYKEVEEETKSKGGPVGTARGIGRERLRKSIKTSSKPRYREA